MFKSAARKNTGGKKMVTTSPPPPLKGEMVAYLRHAGMVDEHDFLPSYHSYGMQGTNKINL
jgi:hypothetical protein